MNCSNVIFKGEDAVLRFYIEDDYSNLEIKVYTDGKTMVTPSEITTEDGLVTMYFHDGDLDILNDGVLRYDVQYDVDGETVINSICSDRYLKTPDGYSAMTADEVYDEGYRDGFRDGLSGDCSSAITEAFQSGYTDGHLAGMVEQAIADANRLTHLSATTNGTYTAPYGFSEVVVDVPTSSGSSSGDCSEAIRIAYDSGWTGGIQYQKTLLSSTAFTSNGTHTTTGDGWSSVTVNVSGGSPARLTGAWYDLMEGDFTGFKVLTMQDLAPTYDGITAITISDKDYGESKIAEGEALQKSKLGSRSITSNGTFTTTGDGWSSVTVNVSTPHIWASGTTVLSEPTNLYNVILPYQGLWDYIVGLKANGDTDYTWYISSTDIVPSGTYDIKVYSQNNHPIEVPTDRTKLNLIWIE